MTAYLLGSHSSGRRGATIWSRVATVTWLTYRGPLLGLGLVFIALAAVIVIPALAVNSDYARYIVRGCGHASTFSCQKLLGVLDRSHTWANVVGLLLLVFPLVASVFVGAPLVARGIESGTFRFMWTQGIGRTRTELGRVAVVAAVAAFASCVLGLLMGWYVHPLEHLHTLSPWDGRLFNVTVVTLPAWTLFTLAVGVVLGMLIHRIVPAMAMTALLCGGILLFAGAPAFGPIPSLTRNVLSIAPAVARTSSPDYGLVSGSGTNSRFVSRGSWLVASWLRSPHGRTVPANTLWILIPEEPQIAQAPGPWLTARHYTFWVSYQPADRYSKFQVLVASALVVLACTLGFITVRLVRHFG